MKKILITGGSGFVGQNIGEVLRKNPEYDVWMPSSSELNCIDEIAVKEYLEKNKFDVVLNLAVYGDGIDKSKDGSKILEYNLRMYLNFAKYNHLYKRMIYAGSGAEYDKRYPICSVKESDIGKSIPVDQYGLMKYTVGQMIEQSDNIYNLRIFGLFGKNEYWPVKFISNICCKSLCNLPLTVRQNVYFDYMWIDDYVKFVEAFINLEKPKHHTYNVVSGQRIDLVSLCEIVNRVSEKESQIIVCREGLANEYTADNSRICEEISDINITPIEESVKYLYDWYRDHKEEIDIYKLIY